MKLQGNFWHKLFRFGFNSKGLHSNKYNGHSAKTSTTAGCTRSKIKRLLERIDPTRNIHNFEL